LISVNASGENPQTNALINNTLWNAFYILFIIYTLLLNEIAAHDKTDKELQYAKENAEAASNAKSRYLTGISHEVRTPLNSILGYAQLLENDKDLPQSALDQISVMRRSGEHLADSTQ